jgi:hypothetical protein
MPRSCAKRDAFSEPESAADIHESKIVANPA